MTNNTTRRSRPNKAKPTQQGEADPTRRSRPNKAKPTQQGEADPTSEQRERPNK